MLVRCRECGSEHRLVGFEGDERVVRYYCRVCERIVLLDLELAEVPSSSSSGSFRRLERRPTVLVADDEPEIRRVACQLLREAGYRVREAADGSEALRAIREGRPDLVVLDLLMPNKSGFDVIREMRLDAETREIPVLIVSGVAPGDPRDLLRRPGVRGFVHRDRLADRLVSETAQLLGRRPSS